MESNEKQVKYANILEIIDGMKQDVVNTSMQQLLMTGTMPEIAQNELKVLSQITGAIFNGIISIGTEVYEDENNSGLVYTKINGKKYSCAKINISNSVSITSKPLSASEAYSMTANTVENIVENIVEETVEENAKKVSIEEFESKEVPTSEVVEPQVEEKNLENPYELSSEANIEIPLEEVSQKPTFVEEKNYEFTPYQLDEASEFGDEPNEDYATNEKSLEDKEEPVRNVPQPQQKPQVQTPQPYDDLTDDDDFGSNDTTYQPTKPEPQVQVPVKEEPVKAEVKTFTRNDMWEEEQNKDVNTMIYNMSKLTVSHIGGGRPEEIIVMMAPLKISRVSSPAVPIVVTLYNRGKVVTKSSYEMGDGGKSIVTLDINEFYLLCRGSFDENGKFKAFITTTGPSSHQGDRINVVSSKTYGNSQDPETKNGHVKMRYHSESGEGTIEVFPFGTSEDNEFIIMVKNPEFCDNYYINQNGRTGTSAIIYGANGKLEVIPNWNGKILEVEVFEK